MAIFGSKPKKQLSEEGQNGLFLVLTEQNCLKPRYASAFLAAFSTDLEDQLPAAFHAGNVVNTAHNGPTRLDYKQVQHLLEVTIAIVAIAQYRKLNAYSQQFAPDVEKAIWAIICVLGKVAEEVDAAVAGQVQKSVERVLGDSSEYINDPKKVLATLEWDVECDKAIEVYNAGEIDDAEFANDALDLLERRPRWLYT